MSPPDMIEQVLMERMRHGDWEPGHEFTETDLARLSGVSTASVREFLIGFSRFHMVERRPRGGWKLLGLHVEFAKEVAEMREMIELTAMRRLATAASGLQCRQRAQRLLDEHRVLLAQMPQKYKEFRALDREFHLWLISQLENRFASDFFDIVSFVFYYHYKWNANEELLRNRTALEEHIGILESLIKQDTDLATQELTNHLLNSRSMLISSLK
jgi:DNA-binding GntR family transcriptional regulator